MGTKDANLGRSLHRAPGFPINFPHEFPKRGTMRYLDLTCLCQIADLG